MVRGAPYGYSWAMDRETRERICMLVDELLRRGVPRIVVQGILVWLDAQDGAYRPKDLRHGRKGIDARSGSAGAKGN